MDEITCCRYEDVVKALTDETRQDIPFPLRANALAQTLEQPDGLVKLVCEAGSGRILGVHLMGPRATDLIAEGALAVQLGATADDLAWTIHAHPMLSEAVLEAALGWSDSMVHYHKR